MIRRFSSIKPLAAAALAAGLLLSRTPRANAASMEEGRSTLDAGLASPTLVLHALTGAFQDDQALANAEITPALWSPTTLNGTAEPTPETILHNFQSAAARVIADYRQALLRLAHELGKLPLERPDMLIARRFLLLCRSRGLNFLPEGTSRKELTNLYDALPGPIRVDLDASIRTRLERAQVMQLRLLRVRIPLFMLSQADRWEAEHDPFYPAIRLSKLPPYARKQFERLQGFDKAVRLTNEMGNAPGEQEAAARSLRNLGITADALGEPEYREDLGNYQARHAGRLRWTVTSSKMIEAIKTHLQKGTLAQALESGRIYRVDLPELAILLLRNEQGADVFGLRRRGSPLHEVLPDTHHGRWDLVSMIDEPVLRDEGWAKIQSLSSPKLQELRNLLKARGEPTSPSELLRFVKVLLLSGGYAPDWTNVNEHRFTKVPKEIAVRAFFQEAQRWLLGRYAPAGGMLEGQPQRNARELDLDEATPSLANGLPQRQRKLIRQVRKICMKLLDAVKVVSRLDPKLERGETLRAGSPAQVDGLAVPWELAFLVRHLSENLGYAYGPHGWLPRK